MRNSEKFGQQISLLYEKKLWEIYTRIAGVDEVGRGALAGPVVAAAVVFSKKINKGRTLVFPRIDDSKKLTPLQRANADKWIKKNCLSWGVGETSANTIDQKGIVKATNSAIRRALAEVNANYLLIDAFYVPYVKNLRRKNQEAIIKGDEKCFSIAAASIVAKVYRDNLMTKLSQNTKFKAYSWNQNKGYGTKQHIKAIKNLGTSKHHRKTFIH